MLKFFLKLLVLLVASKLHIIFSIAQEINNSNTSMIRLQIFGYTLFARYISDAFFHSILAVYFAWQKKIIHSLFSYWDGYVFSLMDVNTYIHAPKQLFCFYLFLCTFEHLILLKDLNQLLAKLLSLQLSLCALHFNFLFFCFSILLKSSFCKFPPPILFFKSLVQLILIFEFYFLPFFSQFKS